MGTVVFSPAIMRACGDIIFGTIAIKAIYPCWWSSSSVKAVVQNFIKAFRAKLVTNNECVGKRPVIVTDCTPRIIVENFNSSRQGIWSSYQPYASFSSMTCKTAKSRILEEHETISYKCQLEIERICWYGWQCFNVLPMKFLLHSLLSAEPDLNLATNGA